MTEFNRTGESFWKGDLRSGSGKISSSSKVLSDVDYRFATRFDNEPGTNPEELIATAHAACYNMALSGTLKSKGYEPDELHTVATCTLASKEGGGYEITKMHLKVNGSVPGLTETEFKEIAQEADHGCPVSNLLRHGLKIELEAFME
jgi:osmotically inducible protein OsmC